jgi:cytochrome P450
MHPIPASHLLWGHTQEFFADPLGFIRKAAQYGPVARLRLANEYVFLLTEPEDIKHVLVDNNKNYIKSRGVQILKRVLGDGLLTAEGDFWRRQRRLIQPAFHRSRIAAYATVMVDYTARHLADWRHGEQRDIHEEMMRLTMEIVTKCLFDADIRDEAPQLGQAISWLVEGFDFRRIGPIGEFLDRFDRKRQRLFEENLQVLDRMIYDIIEQRRASGEDRGDLLSMLLHAQDEEAAEGEETRMTDKQVRDEAITLFSAGHETTANALSWAFYLLAQYPDVETRLHDELDRVLGQPPHGRLPTLDDLPNLPYTRQVFAESMRVYPPAWIIGRQAVGEDNISGCRVPPGRVIFMSQYATHHDARFWPEPEKFIPERFAPEAVKERPKFAYFPFGGGPRLCIGEPFAWMEGHLVLAAIAHRYRLHLAPGQIVRPQPRVTLRPAGGIRMILQQRGM